MAKPTPFAGGFFLILAILAGFGLGMRRGDPVGGTLIGLLVGIAITTVLWLIDKQRIRKATRVPSAPKPDLPTRGDALPRSRGR